MCGRYFSMEELMDGMDEWNNPDGIPCTRSERLATKRKLLSCIRKLEAENNDLRRQLSTYKNKKEDILNGVK